MQGQTSITAFFPMTAQPGMLVSVSGVSLTVDGISIGNTVVGLSNLTMYGDTLCTWEVPVLPNGRYMFCLSVLGICFEPLDSLTIFKPIIEVSLPKPKLNFIKPTHIEADYWITVTGQHLQSITGVCIGHYSISDWSYVTDTSFTAKVPQVNALGKYVVSVTSTLGKSSPLHVTVTGFNRPSINGYRFQSGKSQATAGDTLYLFGINFHSVTGVVLGNSTINAGQYLDSSLTKLAFLVPSGILPGSQSITLYTKRGSTNALQIPVAFPELELYGFEPRSGRPGDKIRFSGKHLSQVQFILMGSDTLYDISYFDENSFELTLTNQVKTNVPILVGISSTLEASDSLEVLLPVSVLLPFMSNYKKAYLVLESYGTNTSIDVESGGYNLYTSLGTLLWEGHTENQVLYLPALPSGVFLIIGKESMHRYIIIKP